MKFKDLTGETFGRWKVLSRGPNSKRNRTQYFCQCTCGREAIVDSTNLRLGCSNSCKNCQFLDNTDPKFHGKHKTKVYKSYHGMLSRCYNENTPYYHRYGGRGITVCQTWKESFLNFISDMGERPFGMELERIDNEKGYSKNNCRWATRKEQCQNKSTSIRIGEINNNWIVIRRGDQKKQWFVKCQNHECGIEKSTTHVRQLAKCQCQRSK